MSKASFAPSGLPENGCLIVLATRFASVILSPVKWWLLGTTSPAELVSAIQERFNLAAAEVDGHVRLEQPDGHEWISRLVQAFPEQIQTITLGKPTLEDVFIDLTGHRYEE